MKKLIVLSIAMVAVFATSCDKKAETTTETVATEEVVDTTAAPAVDTAAVAVDTVKATETTTTTTEEVKK